MAYYLGVDGGASKTAALVTDDAGHALGDGMAGPSNHLRVGIETAARNIERAVNKALVTADVASREIIWTYCGIAGSDHPAHRQEVVDSLSVFFPRGNFTVDNDARIALTGAIGFGPGVVVIAGTGSVAVGRNAGGEEARAGGWGPIVGDEGSGYAIARAGLAAVLRAYDGRGRAHGHPRGDESTSYACGSVIDRNSCQGVRVTRRRGDAEERMSNSFSPGLAVISPQRRAVTAT